VKIKFNATGTHMNRGLLKVRLDFYPDESDKCYPTFYIDQWDREPTDEEMADEAKLALIPTQKVLTPCLCHFITVPENLVVADFTDYILSVLDKDTLASIDGFVLRSDSAHLISPLMRNRCRFSAMPVVTNDTDDLIATTNDKLRAIGIDFAGGGKVIEIEPQSIDIGSAAADYNYPIGAGWTEIDFANPANASGTIDTYQTWFWTNAAGFRAGTAFLVSGTTFECRDSEAIGDVTAGAVRTFTGLTIAVVTGDVTIHYCTSGAIENNSSGGTAVGGASGEHIDPADQLDIGGGYHSGWKLALYGTGTESGGTEKTASDSGAGADGSSLLATIAKSESGGGLDSRLSFLASLARADTGSSGDGVTGRGLGLQDSGLGADTGMIPGMKSIFGGEGGIGYDALKALIETPGAGSDMKLPGRQGHVRIPSKGVSL
jgi:hypothetical protein